VVIYTCDEGHTVDGTLNGLKEWSVTCEASGSFSTPTPAAESCVEVTTNVRGKVQDATNLQAVPGAEVEFFSSGGRRITTTTDASGIYEATGVPAGVVTAKAGLIDKYIGATKTVDTSMNLPPLTVFTLSPVLPPDGWRVVLTWASRPRDLDSYVYFGTNQRCKVYYSRKYMSCGGVDVTLDVDDTNGNGPETVTFSKVSTSCRSQTTCKFIFKVNNYSKNPSFLDSQVKVVVYNGDHEMAKYTIDDGKLNQNWWSVFSIDGKTGTIEPCQTVQCV
jgi:stress response protein SCP2